MGISLKRQSLLAANSFMSFWHAKSHEIRQRGNYKRRQKLLNLVKGWYLVLCFPDLSWARMHETDVTYLFID